MTFTQVGAPQPLDRMTSPLLGVSAFNGTAGTPASFEWFNLSTPDGDEFDGTSLSDCRWSTIAARRSRASCASQGGELQIDAIDGDLYNGTDTAKNVILQPAPQGGKWEAVDQGEARLRAGRTSRAAWSCYKDEPELRQAHADGHRRATASGSSSGRTSTASRPTSTTR